MRTMWKGQKERMGDAWFPRPTRGNLYLDVRGCGQHHLSLLSMPLPVVAQESAGGIVLVQRQVSWPYGKTDSTSAGEPCSQLAETLGRNQIKQMKELIFYILLAGIVMASLTVSAGMLSKNAYDAGWNGCMVTQLKK